MESGKVHFFELLTLDSIPDITCTRFENYEIDKFSQVVVVVVVVLVYFVSYLKQNTFIMVIGTTHKCYSIVTSI